MFSENVITDIIYWIEENLEKDLKIENISQKSGYSKWHLQRMFKEQTGLTLASYIRARRLSCAAVELRLQRTSLLDIALKYRFDSQQTFSRAFKKLFNMTPYNYRRKENWQAHGFTLPLRKFRDFNLDIEIVTIDSLSLIGVEHTYKANMIDWNFSTEKSREEYWKIFFQNALYKHNRVYAIHNILSNKNDELMIKYATMMENTPEVSNAQFVNTTHIENAKYLKFSIPEKLLTLEYKDIIYNIYGILLKKLNIPRKKGSPDIEEYIFEENCPVSELINRPIPLVKDVNYYIPIEIDG
ncbi:helix-turn-helix domain-containing protein [Proteus vulgaris]|uniref:helix-turn-helix domain-containing protein n=1 Tax=Proteus vulgaris TaxID=585 RepID=UPI0018E49483|nr:helix-turn-helix domain-containing protein [Proteus vulgaris]MBI6530892.1 helix-turn-helix domain-containing protein [Proteus vulgaris]